MPLWMDRPVRECKFPLTDLALGRGCKSRRRRPIEILSHFKECNWSLRWITIEFTLSNFVST